MDKSEKQVNKTKKPIQEMDILRSLAGNDEKKRHKTLKFLKKWLVNRPKTKPFTEDDFQRLWKGLYYCMWMSDKPLVQEDCADTIAKLAHLPELSETLLFFKAGLYMLSQEWSGIQQLRLDKFLMLVRRFLREVLFTLKEKKLINPHIHSFNQVLSDTVLNNKNNTPVGLFMHFVEIFIEELAKVTDGKLHSNQIVEFIRPFIKCIATCSDHRKIGYLRKFIFTHLIRQSKLGLEYQARYQAWKQQGFPGTIDSIQKITIENEAEENSEEETEEIEKRKDKSLDPRAGNVDVEIPLLKFKGQDIADALSQYEFDSDSSPYSRNLIKTLIEQFTCLANGVYPLGVKKVNKETKGDMSIRKAANRLLKFDQNLMTKSKKRKLDKENDKEAGGKKRKMLNLEDDENKTSKMNGNVDLNKKNSNKNSIVNGHAPKSQQEKIKTKDHGSKPNKNTNKDSKITVNFNKYQNNINKAKNKVSKEKLKTKYTKLVDRLPDSTANIECIFKRNSGTWVVFETDSSKKGQQKLSKKRTKNGKSNKKNLKPNHSSTNKIQESAKLLNDKIKLDTTPDKLSESPPEREIFPKSPWDDPLQEGEYEYFVSKRHNKQKKKTAMKNQAQNDIINNTLEKIRGKSNLTLNKQLVKNPFPKIPNSKKVQINTKLNRSQDLFDHISSVKSSPGIPYDGSKKPTKSLLKRKLSTPVNPFYKKQISF